jgi:hypothetical protein
MKPFLGTLCVLAGIVSLVLAEPPMGYGACVLLFIVSVMLFTHCAHKKDDQRFVFDAQQRIVGTWCEGCGRRTQWRLTETSGKR